MAKKTLARQNAQCLKKHARYLQRESPACAGEMTVIASKIGESVPVPDSDTTALKAKNARRSAP
jgi:hypothetical protein